jgi:hypothetical protein
MWQIKIRPLATLRGSLDCLRTETLDVSARIEGWPGVFSAIRTAPEINSWVVVVIIDHKRYTGRDDLRIDDGFMDFMPEGNGIATVKGDVLKFLEEIRTAILKAKPPGSPFKR